MTKKVESMCATGCNVINRQLIYDHPNMVLRNKNVLPIEHAYFYGVERLALVLDGEIASPFDDPAKLMTKLFNIWIHISFIDQTR